jgi:heat induced stress protein YflT
MAKDTAVFGLFETRTQLERAVDALRNQGFRATDISIVGRDEAGTTHELAHELNTKAPEGTATGGVAGGAIGGILGWLVGAGVLAVPGVGPLLAAGPVVAALAGIGAGATTGGLIGALVGIGIPEVEARRFEGRIRKGQLLLSIHCDDSDWAARAKETLKSAGAVDLASTRETVGDYHP